MHLAPLSILACIIAVALAQSPNPPKIPSTGYTITAGQSSTFQWTPTTQGTVTLTLRNGAASDLNKGTVIACKCTSVQDAIKHLRSPLHSEV